MNHSKPKVTIFVRCSPTCNWLIINSTKQITSLSCLIKYNANSFSWRLYKQVVLHKAPAHLSSHAFRYFYNQNGYLVIIRLVRE